MAIKEIGVGGFIYSCGCEDRFAEGKSFCEDSAHRAFPCGCYNIGANYEYYMKHRVFYAFILGFGVMAIFLLIAFLQK